VVHEETCLPFSVQYCSAYQSPLDHRPAGKLMHPLTDRGPLPRLHGKKACDSSLATNQHSKIGRWELDAEQVDHAATWLSESRHDIEQPPADCQYNQIILTQPPSSQSHQACDDS
jgi:hypothetical protein